MLEEVWKEKHSFVIEAHPSATMFPFGGCYCKSQVVPVIKNPSANAGEKRRGINLRGGKIPWRTARQCTPVFLPGTPHGQRSLAGYSPKCCKELNTTEATWYLAHTISHRKGANVGQLAPTWMNAKSMRKPSQKNPCGIMPCKHKA